MSDKNIWVLLSIENEYNQPLNNIVAFWHEKPELKQLCAAFGAPDLTGVDLYQAVEKYTELLEVIGLVKLLLTSDYARNIRGTDYRLRVMKPGQIYPSTKEI